MEIIIFCYVKLGKYIQFSYGTKNTNWEEINNVTQIHEIHTTSFTYQEVKPSTDFRRHPASCVLHQTWSICRRRFWRRKTRSRCPPKSRSRCRRIWEKRPAAHTKKKSSKISTRSRLQWRREKITQTELKMGKARAARAQRKDWLCPNPILGPILASCRPREPKKATFLMRALRGFPTSTWTTILALNGRRPSPLGGNLRAESPVSLWAPLPPLLTRGPR